MVYLVTLFRIDSELHIQDAVSQEIDHRVVKRCEALNEALSYVSSIRNRMLMFNFPFAMVQHITKDECWEIQQQWLYNFDDVSAEYRSLKDLNCLTLATRRKLHDFEEEVRLVTNT